MALGNYNGTKTNYCSLDNKNAKIKLRKKVDGVVEETPFAYLEGVLIDIKPTEWEFEGSIIPQVKLLLNDPDSGENYSLEFNRNAIFGRDVLNKLANIPAIEFIRITPWSSEVDGKTYTHGAVRHKDIKVENKFKKGEYPEIEVEKLKSGKEVLDSTARDAFFEALIPQIKAAIVNKQTVWVPELKEADLVEAERDDIPF